jgi:hypothetical protein
MFAGRLAALLGYFWVQRLRSTPYPEMKLFGVGIKMDLFH